MLRQIQTTQKKFTQSNKENQIWEKPLKFHKSVVKTTTPMLISGGDSGKTDVELENILRSETDRAPFQQFLQQQFCAENLTFYLAVEEYRKIPESDVCFFFLI